MNPYANHSSDLGELSRAGIRASHQQMLGADSHRHQFRVAVGILHGFDCIFSSKSAHNQGKFAVGCRLNGETVNPQHILRSVSAAAIHFHHKLDVFHKSFQDS
jgi:hypothetical protein